MKIAIVERIENYDEEKPFNKRYYLDSSFREIFDELDILLIPVISEKNLEEICNICDGLVVTGSPNDVHKSESIKVNSYHKQSIKDIAPEFKITAISDDGIIERIEKDNIVAVQWHPEVLYDMNFFRSFIEKFLKNKI